MFDVERIEDWQGQDVIDTDGEKVGRLEEVFVDAKTREPAIGSVKTGRFGRKLTLVPLEGASLSRDYLRVPFSKEQLDGAPQAGSGEELTVQDEDSIFLHYGIEREPSEGELQTVRYETAGAQESRGAEAESLRQKAQALEASAGEHSELAEGERSTADEHRQAGDRADEQGAAKHSEAEELRKEADRLESGR